MGCRLFTQAAIDKLKETITPRFKDLPAGFNRVGPRKVDKGKAAMIEILKNPYSEFERNEELVRIWFFLRSKQNPVHFNYFI